jgi:multidrug resistance efflux pump
MAKSDRKTIDKIFVLLGLVTVLVLVAVGGLAWKASSFAKSSVENQMKAQDIFFPPKSSPAITELPTADQVQMNKYAGQQLINGAQAEVYADNFIAYHLTKVADGQTYAQVSAQALANPNNAQLKAEEQTLFQGETLRGLLLGDGYSYWTIGQIAGYVAITAFIGAAVMVILVLMGLGHLSKSK